MILNRSNYSREVTGGYDPVDADPGLDPTSPAVHQISEGVGSCTPYTTRTRATAFVRSAAGCEAGVYTPR